jgi:hypothetical protein
MMVDFMLTILLLTFNEGNWNFNFNYWTGGTNKNFPSQWSWCGSQPVVGLSDNLKWETGQPDNRGGKEECLHLRFVQNATGTILTDRNCTAKYIYACEVCKEGIE